MIFRARVALPKEILEHQYVFLPKARLWDTFFLEASKGFFFFNFVNRVFKLKLSYLSNSKFKFLQVKNDLLHVNLCVNKSFTVFAFVLALFSNSFSNSSKKDLWCSSFFSSCSVNSLISLLSSSPS